MLIALETLLAASISVIAWCYLGYPIYLWVSTRLQGQASEIVPVGDLPGVSLIISAYNESAVIQKKLDNAANLSYPQELLEIIVVSDASDDGTDEIVRDFGKREVRLCRQDQRQGKTAGLTEHVPSAKHELLLFTDANAIFEEQAIGNLVRHFIDPEVGYVVGQQKYLSGEVGDAGNSESLYWKYETWIKKQESRIDSVVGGDGAIYATRKSLFQPLRVDDINDFVNPLQIIAKGHKGVYEPEAICFEHAAGSFHGEFQRKIRIVNRSIRATFRVPTVLNPFRTGLFAFHLFSHKLVRWLTSFFMVTAFASNVAICLLTDAVGFRFLLAMQLIFYGLAACGFSRFARNFRCISFPFYFCLANLAAGIGVATYIMGHKYISWSPDRTAVQEGPLASNSIQGSDDLRS